ncbi:MAG: B12-binding domain-containing radical SAM protein [Nanoarchaeota archaeon]|nr:B12-binding domain-containing radical SAM protein [Nanoarchaeota archaeon]MBU1005768.1 B12-binding domain-containing radical SAM protein [Nanoarchaeota archaeon]MBU1946639.1 B12-binding domain-containing radical SAM protein [Nanoarchaeota archaeon]
MKKVCLVYPNTIKLPKSFRYANNLAVHSNNTLPPLGLLYIIGNSKNKIDIIDNRIRRYSEDILFERLMKYDIIGFGGTIFEAKEARKVSRRLIKNGKTTIYGGPNAMVNWRLYTGEFTIILRGEAEMIFDKIIENIPKIEGLGFRKIKNTYINPSPKRISQLDNLEFPDRSKINLDEYRRIEPEFLGNIHPVDTIVSSRGCPFDCYFCSSKVIWGRRYTYRSADSIIKEIKFMIKNYGTKGIYFREDNFTANRSRLVDFCNKVSSLKILWICESRADSLDKKTIKLMADSGCKAIWFGIECTDDEDLRRIRKGITLSQIKRTINLCNERGILTGGGFMLGLPFDTERSIKKNYKLSKTLKLKYRFYNRVYAFPGSEMYDEILHEGIDNYCFENIMLPGTRHLSAKRVNRLYYQLVSRNQMILSWFSNILGRKLADCIKMNFPNIIRLLRRILDLS